MTQPHTDAIAVGGGIIGLLTARELVQAGHRVHVIDQGTMGRESSWAGGGILSPLYPWRYPDPVNELARWSQGVYRQLAQQLHEVTGIDAEWTRSGMLLLDASEPHRAETWARQFGSHLELLPVEAVPGREPALAPVGEPAWWMPEVAQVRNPRLLQALRSELQGAGVQFTEQCAVEEILVENDRVTGVRAGGTTFRSGAVIIASGAWTGRLLAGLPNPPAIRAVRGQMLLFRAAPGVLRRIVLGLRHYIIPRRDGRVLVGSTMEEVGFDKSTTEAARDELMEAAYRRVPALRQYPLEMHWAGLRPGSPTGVPYIGEHPDVTGLFINSGHFRNGVVMAPASARLLADLMLGRPPILEPAPYGLVR